MSSWVLRGLLAARATSAPPAIRMRIRLAVSLVTCMAAAMRMPLKGCSRLKRSSIRSSTGISLAAHCIRKRPFSARLMSAMS